MSWTSGKLLSNGLNLHYTRTGGAKPPLLVLHGFTDFGGNWRTFARLAEDRFDVIMPDLRSHGYSDRKPDYSADDLADDAAGVLRGLGITQATIMGHSMGAVTALRTAAKFPGLASRVILEDPPFWDKHVASQYEMTPWEQSLIDFNALSPEAQTREAIAKNPKWTAEEAQLWGDAKPLFDIAGFKSPIKLFWPDWRADTRAMATQATPGLLIMGENALGAIVTRETATAMQALWPQLQTVTIPATGHNIRRDDVAAYAAAVLAYLASAD